MTAALVDYHLGGNAHAVAPALTLFPYELFQRSLGLPYSNLSGTVLFGNYPSIFSYSAPVWAFLKVLRRVTDLEVVKRTPNWDYGSQAELASELAHLAVVYIPDTPYKNSFNDFYAMGLPMFVPAPGFLAKFWPRLQVVETFKTYDGWFDRGLPRFRLQHAIGRSTVPEPFDLGVEGEAKVRHWVRLADYYRFPGVFIFDGGAHLGELLASADLHAARAKMRQHLLHRHSSIVNVLRALLPMRGVMIEA